MSLEVFMKQKQRVPEHPTKQKVFLILECRMGGTKVVKIHATHGGAVKHLNRLKQTEEIATHHLIEKSVTGSSIVLNTEDTLLIHIYK